MKVICKGLALTAEQKHVLHVPERFNPTHQLTVGASYVVLAISVIVAEASWHGCVLQICDDVGRCTHLPLCLAEIVDPRPSRHWIAKQEPEHHLKLWPQEFYQEYFHEELSERVPEVVAAFQQVVHRLATEFDG